MMVKHFENTVLSRQYQCETLNTPLLFQTVFCHDIVILTREPSHNIYRNTLNTGWIWFFLSSITLARILSTHGESVSYDAD